MHEDIKEIKKGMLSQVGKAIVIGLGLGLAALWWQWKKLWEWWKQFQFTAQTIARIEFWLLIVGGLVVVVLVLAFIINLLKRNGELQQLLHSRQFPAPDAAPLSKVPRSSKDSVGRYMERPSDMAFHVLKLLAQAHGSLGGMNVKIISYRCQISEDDALHCVKELRELGFIRTATIAPGEWNAEYAITERGMGYVLHNAT